MRLRFFVSILLYFFCVNVYADVKWPQVYSDGRNQLHVYQPQIASWKNRLTVSGKVAVQLVLAGTKTPLVGAMWFTADTAVNDDLTMIFLNNFAVTQVVFYEKDQASAKNAVVIAKNILGQNGVILSLDQLLSMVLSAKDIPKKADIKMQIPHLATVKRDQVSLMVDYTGTPVFKPILGTSLDYAANTTKTVIKVGGRYFALSNGIWFIADSATGPWKVAVNIPNELDQIPQASPLRNAAFVKIYSVNPQAREVVFGFTGGYVGNKANVNPYTAWPQGVVTQWDEWSQRGSQANMANGLEGDLFVGKDKKVYRHNQGELEKYEAGAWSH